MTTVIHSGHTRSADTLTPSMGFAITALNGKLYAGGFKTDSAYHNENLYVMIADTTGPAIAEWVYNGKGDAITRGQFVRIDAQNNVYCAATTDRLGFQTGLDVSTVKMMQQVHNYGNVITHHPAGTTIP